MEMRTQLSWNQYEAADRWYMQLKQQGKYDNNGKVWQ